MRKAQEKQLTKSTVIYQDEKYAMQDYDLDEEKEKEGRTKMEYLRICMCKVTYHYDKMIEAYNVSYRYSN